MTAFIVLKSRPRGTHFDEIMHKITEPIIRLGNPLFLLSEAD